MDYTTMKEDGHWKCILFSNMFLCGELRQRKLLLCCIPRPCFKILAFFFGERKLGSGGSCSICSALFTCLLFPLALALALVALVAVMVIAVLFMPVLIVFYLPGLVYAKCRYKTERAHHQIVKITESESKPDNFLLVEADRISMGDMKPDTNCTNL
jgi:hypothetical protein